MMASRDQGPPSHHAQRLFDALYAYGVSNDASAIDALRMLYGETAPRVSEGERVSMVVAFAQLAEARQCSINPLFAFVFEDPAPRVISTAALHVAPLWCGESPADVLFGPRMLLQIATRHADAGDEVVAIGIVQGLLLLGDRRVVHEVGPFWRRLTAAGRQRLAHLIGMRVHAPVVDWLLDWIEEVEGSELAGVAGVLSRLASQATAQGEVVEVRRALPLWVDPPEPPLQDLQVWSPAEFAARIGPRVRALAAAEEGERVLIGVLRDWGIPLDGVATLAEIQRLDQAVAAYRANAGVIPPAARASSMPFPAVLVEPNEIPMRHPVLYLAWGIFNPYGPTVNLLGRTRGEDVDFLWYAMLNPFQQVYAVLGSLTGDDRLGPGAIADQLDALVQANVVACANGGELPLVAVPPSFLFASGDPALSREEALGCFLRSPGIRRADLHAVVAQLDRTEGDPWARATEQLRGWRPDRTGAQGEFATDEEVIAWLQRVLAREQWLVELTCWRDAWRGAILEQRRNGSADPAARALPLATVEDLAVSLGFPALSMIADVERRRAEGERE